jgi:hypothetical protein
MESAKLERAAHKSAAKYRKNLGAPEICLVSEGFKHQAQMLESCVETATYLELFRLIQDYLLSSCYPDIETALHIFLALPVIVASCEWNFSKLKIIYNDLKLTVKFKCYFN